MYREGEAVKKNIKYTNTKNNGNANNKEYGHG